VSDTSSIPSWESARPQQPAPSLCPPAAHLGVDESTVREDKGAGNPALNGKNLNQTTDDNEDSAGKSRTHSVTNRRKSHFPRGRAWFDNVVKPREWGKTENSPGRRARVGYFRSGRLSPVALPRASPGLCWARQAHEAHQGHHHGVTAPASSLSCGAPTVRLTVGQRSKSRRDAATNTIAVAWCPHCVRKFLAVVVQRWVATLTSPSLTRNLSDLRATKLDDANDTCDTFPPIRPLVCVRARVGGLYRVTCQMCHVGHSSGPPTAALGTRSAYPRCAFAGDKCAVFLPMRRSSVRRPAC
jgi:hypothetical protein